MKEILSIKGKKKIKILKKIKKYSLKNKPKISNTNWYVMYIYG